MTTPAGEHLAMLYRLVLPPLDPRRAQDCLAALEPACTAGAQARAGPCSGIRSATSSDLDEPVLHGPAGGGTPV